MNSAVVHGAHTKHTYAYKQNKSACDLWDFFSHSLSFSPPSLVLCVVHAVVDFVVYVARRAAHFVCLCSTHVAGAPEKSFAYSRNKQVMAAWQQQHPLLGLPSPSLPCLDKEGGLTEILSFGFFFKNSWPAKRKTKATTNTQHTHTQRTKTFWTFSSCKPPFGCWKPKERGVEVGRRAIRCVDWTCSRVFFWLEAHIDVAISIIYCSSPCVYSFFLAFVTITYEYLLLSFIFVIFCCCSWLFISVAVCLHAQQLHKLQMKLNKRSKTELNEQTNPAEALCICIVNYN